MAKPLWIALAAGLLTLGACGHMSPSGPPQPGPQIPGDADRVTITPDDRLLTEQSSANTERRRLVLRSEGEWQTFWQSGNRTGTPPAVDFEREMVVVAAAGEKPTGGYDITIDEVHRKGDTLFVVVREVSPGRGCMVTQALTAPATALKVPRTTGPVHFIERPEVRDCA